MYAIATTHYLNLQIWCQILEWNTFNDATPGGKAAGQHRRKETFAAEQVRLESQLKLVCILMRHIKECVSNGYND